MLSPEQVLKSSDFEEISLREAFMLLTKCRIDAGFAPMVADLLTYQDAQPKFSKTPWPMAGLSLLPYNFYDESINLCPKATYCPQTCLNFQGRGRFTPTQLARKWRTDLLVKYPRAFYTVLNHELKRFEKKVGPDFLFRPNVFSDVKWELVLPDEWWDRFSEVRVMDYTKRWDRPEFPRSNYRLAFSVGAKAQLKKIDGLLERGSNVAIVFDVAKQESFPEFVGDYRLVDGDTHDNLWDRGNGVILALRAKGNLKKVDSKFKFGLDSLEGNR